MRPIRRSERHESLVRQLAETPHPDGTRPVFPTMRELLCFAAVLGFEREKRREVDSKSKEIDGRTFESHEQSRDIIYLIALAHAKDAEILREENEDRCLRIFEEYAEGGLDEIASWLKERPDDVNGDIAILDALRKRGFLGLAREVDDAIHDVSF